MFRFLDAHTHAQFAAYDADRGAVISRALSGDVAIINVGTNRETSEAAVRLVLDYPEGVCATVGIHPTYASGTSFHDKKETLLRPKESGEIFDKSFYKSLALGEKVVAIGECGLDYYRVEGGALKATSEKQKKVFLEHVELSYEVKKPLMIHCRSAFSDLIDLLNSKSSILNPIPGIIHFFSGTKSDAESLLDLGFYFTFGGVITFVEDYNEVVKLIPLDRILSETDAPYVTPAPYRGKRNEPAYVVEVVKKLAELKGLSVEVMAEQILKNARTVFPGFDI